MRPWSDRRRSTTRCRASPGTHHQRPRSNGTRHRTCARQRRNHRRANASMHFTTLRNNVRQRLPRSRWSCKPTTRRGRWRRWRRHGVRRLVGKRVGAGPAGQDGLPTRDASRLREDSVWSMHFTSGAAAKRTTTGIADKPARNAEPRAAHMALTDRKRDRQEAMGQPNKWLWVIELNGYRAAPKRKEGHQRQQQ